MRASTKFAALASAATASAAASDVDEHSLRVAEGDEAAPRKGIQPPTKKELYEDDSDESFVDATDADKKAEDAATPQPPQHTNTQSSQGSLLGGLVDRLRGAKVSE